MTAGPAPTGTEHPGWYLDERSATVRQAFDILQEIAFRKLVKSKTNDSKLAWEPPLTSQVDLSDGVGWKLLYHQGSFAGTQDTQTQTHRHGR